MRRRPGPGGGPHHGLRLELLEGILWPPTAEYACVDIPAVEADPPRLRLNRRCSAKWSCWMEVVHTVALEAGTAAAPGRAVDGTTAALETDPTTECDCGGRPHR